MTMSAPWKARPHLALVQGSAGTPPPLPRKPVLVGLLLCEDGGRALGVVRQVAPIEGGRLRLRVLPDPEAGLGASELTFDLDLVGPASSSSA